MEDVQNGTARRKYRKWSELERQQIIDETLKPGASVARIAREHGANTNQVFNWRRQYRLKLALESGAGQLVRVEVPDGQERAGNQRMEQSPLVGVIEIDLGHAGVRIEGAADPDCVRAALAGLAR